MLVLTDAHLVHWNDLLNGFVRVEDLLMEDKVFIFQLLVSNQVHDVELDGARAVENSKYNILLLRWDLLVAFLALNQLLSEHDYGLLWDLDVLSEALVGHLKIVLCALLHLVFEELCHVLHVDQVAHLVIV